MLLVARDGWAFQNIISYDHNIELDLIIHLRHNWRPLFKYSGYRKESALFKGLIQLSLLNATYKIQVKDKTPACQTNNETNR